MAQWGIPWDYIEEHWTEAQFDLMFQMLQERLQAEAEAIRGKGKSRGSGGGNRIARPDGQLARFLDEIREGEGSGDAHNRRRYRL